jgi:hemolysin activation/secretion protein
LIFGAVNEAVLLRRRVRVLVAAILMTGQVVGQSPAQSPTTDFSRQQEERARIERLEALRKNTPRADAKQAHGQPAILSAPNDPCFIVERVEVDGVTQLPQSAVAAITDAYHARCVGHAEINAAMRDLTHLYLDKGFVAARVYVPEQDIAKAKILRLIVAEGTLSDIYLNGKPAPASGVLATAFPGLRGRIVNMRDVEQGLDQINRLSSNDAKTAMLPGPEDGTSIVNVENAHAAPWHLSFANSNLGQESTGYSKSSVSFSMDNMLGWNDGWNFTYERTGPDYPWDEDGDGKSDSFSGGVSVPYGYWTFAVDGSWYDYDSSVPGNFGQIDTSGDSRQLGFNADRVVHRDSVSITTVNAALTYKETNNFLLGNIIEVGSRRYSVGSLGISHSRQMLGGTWAFDLAYEQGLDLFGAVDPDDPGAAGADPLFAKFTGTISATTPFELVKQRFELSSLLSAQYSADSLFGAEQMGLGSYSNVRGTRESVLFGNSGMFIRNDLVWRSVPWATSDAAKTWLGEFRPYLGLDYGRIFAQSRYDIEGGDIVGWTVGARLAGGKFNLDIGYSDILTASVEVPDSGLFYVSGSVRW